MVKLVLFFIAAVIVLAGVWAWKKRGKGPNPRQQKRIADLRQNLRVKVFYDEAKIDRLVDYERSERARKGQKAADTEALLMAAIER
jgi:hypothetical protein